MPSLTSITNGLRNAGRKFFWGDAEQAPTQTPYDCELGFGQGWENLGGVPDWVRGTAERARFVQPQEITYQNAIAEAGRAGDWEGFAFLHGDICKSRKSQIKSQAQIMNQQIDLDNAAFSSASQVAQKQARTTKSMNKMNFGNQSLAANTQAYVSVLRGARQKFTFGGR